VEDGEKYDEAPLTAEQFRQTALQLLNVRKWLGEDLLNSPHRRKGSEISKREINFKRLRNCEIIFFCNIYLSLY